MEAPLLNVQVMAMHIDRERDGGAPAPLASTGGHGDRGAVVVGRVQRRPAGRLPPPLLHSVS